LGSTAAGKIFSEFVDSLNTYVNELPTGLTEGSAEMGRTTVQPTKENNASLSRALLSLSTLEAQQRALHCVLFSMQIQLCRVAVVGIFAQRTVVNDDSISPTQEHSLGDCSGGEPIVQLDWTKFTKHKVIAALWELLKLSSSCKESAPQARISLSNALLGMFSSLVYLSSFV
jgi:hypothetical protein